MNQRVPILVYHHVYPDDHHEPVVPSGERATGIIGAAALRRQLDYLVAEDWQVISTTRLVDWLEQGAGIWRAKAPCTEHARKELWLAIPRRAAVLHFDNGWLDTYTIARPILREYGLTATCYLISDLAAAGEGQPVAVSTSTEGAVAKPGLTWRQAAELLADGWEIGAHTATHPRLAEVHAAAGDAGVVAEIERSHAMYSEALGAVPAHFAYPSGSRNARTDALLAPYYRSLRRWQFTYPPRWTYTARSTSPLALECQNMDNTVSFRDFTHLFEALRAA